VFVGVSTRDYETEHIAVHWDSTRCIHTARCIQSLPEVFDVRRRPWIDLSTAGPDAVAEAVRKCPTGALRYTRRDGAAQETPQQPAVAVPMPDGPLLVMGDLRVQNAEGETIAEETRLTLCRCGRSRNQPFCDNSHIEGGFRSDEFASKDAPPAAAEGQTTITATRDGSLHFEGHVVVLDPDGRELADTGDVWLCRCGNSASKPFCDGSHRGRFTSRLSEVDGERREAETPLAFEPNPQVEPPAEVEP
jgi:CDGSH-type Zn-finger protein/uncharacterized Fe-S cluster protein YjdI